MRGVRGADVKALQLEARIDSLAGDRGGICDNFSIHKGKLVRAWVQRHPRFLMHFTPVHCSWMNQVEQWFSILQRKRLTAPNFPDLAALEERVLAFIQEWNCHAHPFNWTETSFEKTLAKVDAALKAA